MSLDRNDIATIEALISQRFQALQGKKATGLNLGDEWAVSQGTPHQIPLPLDEPTIDPDAVSVMVPLSPPGEIAHKPPVEELAVLPSKEPPPRIGVGPKLPPLSQVWMGRVVIVHDAAVDPSTGQWQTIQVVRVHGYYGANNDPYTTDMPGPPGDMTSTPVTAWPLPMRHDQQKYNVAVGELVAVFIGNDGRHYYMRDDLPFVAVVIKSTATTWEDQVGGAGLLSMSVRRQSLSGDPTGAPPALADLLDAGGTEIEYANVLVIASPWQQHGYRVGDVVWVARRGMYYFVTPGPESFLAYLVTLGPNGEADFANARYWVREVEATIGYTDNTYTYAYADRTLVDPTGSGGRQGRWCMAVNVSVTAGRHDLPLVVAGNAATSHVVEIHVHADPVTGEAWYTFTGSYDFPPGSDGDIWYYADNIWRLLPAGAVGDVLTIQTVGGFDVPTWETPAVCP